MAVSITPTLSSSEGYLTDVRDQVSNLLRFIIMNPGGTSDLWEGKLISFRKLSSAHEGSHTNFCSILSQRISECLHNKFHDFTFDVDCTAEPYDPTRTLGVNDDGRYAVVFKILIMDSNNNVSGVVDGAIKVDKITNNIELTFSDSPDNQKLS